MKQEELRAEFKDLRVAASEAEKEHELAESRSVELSDQLTCLSEEVRCFHDVTNNYSDPLAPPWGHLYVYTYNVLKLQMPLIH